MRHVLRFAIALALLSLTALFLLQRSSEQSVPYQSNRAVKTSATQQRHLPTGVVFEENQGQAPDSAKFIAHAAGYDVLFGESGVTFQFRNESSSLGVVQREDVSLSFEGSNQKAEVEGVERQSGVRNYYIGSDPNHWHAGIPLFGRVRYRDVYPGIDLVFYGTGDGLEFDFKVSPGVDPGQVRFSIDGAHSFSNDGILLGKANQVRVKTPFAYQMIQGQRREVVANYAFDQGKVGLSLATYDTSQALTIDPYVLFQGYVPPSFQAINGGTQPGGVAVDPSGNAYVVESVTNANQGCWVVKFSSTGTVLYQTNYAFTPGNGAGGACNAIAVDVQGDAYITGWGVGFPVTKGVVEPTIGRAFAAKLDATGKLSYSTHIGGSSGDTGTGIAVDPQSNAYLTGYTQSNDFPVVNAFQSTLNGPQDAYVAVLNPTATAFVYSTYLGGSGQDFGEGIAVDATGSAYVVGQPSTGFPLKNPLQSSGAGFLTKFDPAGSTLVYSTYLGQGDSVYPGGVQVDAAGDAFVVFDVNTGTGLLVSVNPAGSALNFSTVPATQVNSIFLGLDAGGNVYVSGALGGSGTITPLKPFDAGPNFVASFTNSGTPIYTSYSNIQPLGMAGAEAGNVYVAGVQGSLDFFSVNMNQTFQGTVISKIAVQDGPALGYDQPVLAFGYQPVGTTSLPKTVTLEDLGTTTLDLNSIVVTGPGFALNSSTCGTTLSPAAAQTCALTITFTPQDTNPAVGAVTITDNSLGSPHALPLSGQGAVPSVTLNPTSLAFPNTPVGQSSAPEIVTLSNTGHATLNFSHIGASGDFSETNTCGTFIFAGQNCPISVVFTPTAIGQRNGSLTITDNAANSPQTVPLSGTGAQSLGLGTASGGFSSATVTAGSMASYSLTIGGTGYSGTATLSCTGAPAGANCSFPSGSTVNVNGTTGTPFTATVTTTGRSAGMVAPFRKNMWFWAVALLGLVVYPRMGKRSNRKRGVKLLPLLLLLGVLCSCGGGSSSGSTGTPIGTYPLTVTATSGSIQQSMQLSLTVQ